MEKWSKCARDRDVKIKHKSEIWVDVLKVHIQLKWRRVDVTIFWKASRSSLRLGSLESPQDRGAWVLKMRNYSRKLSEYWEKQENFETCSFIMWNYSRQLNKISREKDNFWTCSCRPCHHHQSRSPHPHRWFSYTSSTWPFQTDMIIFIELFGNH